jgi:hypothetical protein
LSFKRFILHEIFRNRREKKSFAITSIIFVILFVLFFYLGLTSLDPPENGIVHKLWNDGVGIWKHSTDRTNPSAPIATAAKQAASSNRIFFRILKKLS